MKFLIFLSLLGIAYVHTKPQWLFSSIHNTKFIEEAAYTSTNQTFYNDTSSSLNYSYPGQPHPNGVIPYPHPWSYPFMPPVPWPSDKQIAENLALRKKRSAREKRHGGCCCPCGCGTPLITGCCCPCDCSKVVKKPSQDNIVKEAAAAHVIAERQLLQGVAAPGPVVN